MNQRKAKTTPILFVPRKDSDLGSLWFAGHAEEQFLIWASLLYGCVTHRKFLSLSLFLDFSSSNPGGYSWSLDVQCGFDDTDALDTAQMLPLRAHRLDTIIFVGANVTYAYVFFLPDRGRRQATEDILSVCRGWGGLGVERGKSDPKIKCLPPNFINLNLQDFANCCFFDPMRSYGSRDQGSCWAINCLGVTHGH